MKTIVQEKLQFINIAGVILIKAKYENGDCEDLDIEPSKERKKWKIIVPIIAIIVVAAGITIGCYLNNTKQPAVQPETTTQSSDWVDSKRQVELQEEKYPDHSLPSLTVE